VKPIKGYDYYILLQSFSQYEAPKQLCYICYQTLK
jgi:hypothetical protein